MKVTTVSLRYTLGLGLLAVALVGCKSNHDKEIAAAKQRAATTGQTQTVAWTDKNGDMVTTTILPPGPGQGVNDELVTTTTTPPAGGGQPTTSTTGGGDNNGSNGGGSGERGGEHNRRSGDNSGGNNGGMAGNGGQQQPQMAPITIPSGTTLTVRIDHAIDVKTAAVGDTFTGEVVDPIQDNTGNVAVPKGSPVEGRIDQSASGGRFKGASSLQMRLIAISLNGQQYRLDTADVDKTQKGKGKRTAAFIGGGAGLGALIGGLTGGGKGALIGGLVGGGAGTAGAAYTDNHPLIIPAESVISFTLSNDLTIQR